MSKGLPLIFTMFALVLISASIYAIAWYYGTEDWTWIAQQNAVLTLLLMVLGLALITLVGWLERRR